MWNLGVVCEKYLLLNCYIITKSQIDSWHLEEVTTVLHSDTWPTSTRDVVCVVPSCCVALSQCAAANFWTLKPVWTGVVLSEVIVSVLQSWKSSSRCKRGCEWCSAVPCSSQTAAHCRSATNIRPQPPIAYVRVCICVCVGRRQCCSVAAHFIHHPVLRPPLWSETERTGWRCRLWLNLIIDTPPSPSQHCDQCVFCSFWLRRKVLGLISSFLVKTTLTESERGRDHSETTTVPIVSSVLPQYFSAWPLTSLWKE